LGSGGSVYDGGVASVKSESAARMASLRCNAPYGCLNDNFINNNHLIGDENIEFPSIYGIRDSRENL
jgi:hypothetical protein